MKGRGSRRSRHRPGSLTGPGTTSRIGRSPRRHSRCDWPGPAANPQATDQQRVASAQENKEQRPKQQRPEQWQWRLRHIVGWRVAANMKPRWSSTPWRWPAPLAAASPDRVGDALRRRVARQFTSVRFTERLAEIGIWPPSMIRRVVRPLAWFHQHVRSVTSPGPQFSARNGPARQGRRGTNPRASRRRE